MSTAARLDREWVTIVDPDDDHLHYTFDVSFLLSDYTCIYGRGCQGITGDGQTPDVGCCHHGAYLNEDDDPKVLQRLVKDDLTPDLMQFHAKARKKGVVVKDDEGEKHTRVVDDACIFLNREGFPGGPGCALHRLAEERGEHHMTYKPVVCWQLPLHRAVDERTGNDGKTIEVHTIAAFERGHWGEGGSDFTWYCTDSPEAFIGEQPVYESMEYELVEMVGRSVYAALADHLAARRRQRNVVQFLPVVG